MTENEASKSESAGVSVNKPGSISMSPNQNTVSLIKIKKLHSVLSLIGSLTGFCFTLKAYFAHTFFDPNFKSLYVVYPIALTLGLCFLFVIIQTIYDWVGYGEITNIYDLSIDKNLNLKNVLMALYALISCVLIPLVSYVGTHFFLIIIFMIIEKFE